MNIIDTWTFCRQTHLCARARVQREKRERGRVTWQTTESMWRHFIEVCNSFAVPACSSASATHSPISITFPRNHVTQFSLYLLRTTQFVLLCYCHCHCQIRRRYFCLVFALYDNERLNVLPYQWSMTRIHRFSFSISLCINGFSFVFLLAAIYHSATAWRHLFIDKFNKISVWFSRRQKHNAKCCTWKHIWFSRWLGSLVQRDIVQFIQARQRLGLTRDTFRVKWESSCTVIQRILFINSFKMPNNMCGLGQTPYYSYYSVA